MSVAIDGFLANIRTGRALTVLALFCALLLPLPASAQSELIRPSPSLGTCAGDLRVSLLKIGEGLERTTAKLLDAQALSDFLPRVARRMQQDEERHPMTWNWMLDPELVAIKQRERIHLDLIDGTADATPIAVLRLTNTSLTCGSGGCSTPVFVAMGCDGPAMACLSEGIETGRTGIFSGDRVLITHLSGASFVQTDRCSCAGAAHCFQNIELWRFDDGRQRFHRDGAQRWSLSAPFFD